MLKFIVVLLFPFFTFAQDTYGESERKWLGPEDMTEVNENGRPTRDCEDQQKLLERNDCLRADGKLAPRCKVRQLNKNENYKDTFAFCGQGWLVDYQCKDFVICSASDEPALRNEKKKKTVTEAVK